MMIWHGKAAYLLWSASYKINKTFTENELNVFHCELQEMS